MLHGLADTILDYSGYVEIVSREENAVYDSEPSPRDLKRLASRQVGSADDRDANQGKPFEIFHPRMKLFETLLGRGSARTTPPQLQEVCYVCKGRAQVVRDQAGRKKVGGQRLPQVKVSACPKCGWWESVNFAYLCLDEDSRLGTELYDSYILCRRACLREFLVFDNEAPLAALRAYLIRNPKKLNSISPKQLELLVGSIFSDFFGCEAVHVGGPGDGGFDLVVLMADIPAVVQVKQRIDSRKVEAVSSIREFVGAMILGGQRRGIFVSTAHRFSEVANETAPRAPKLVIEKLELVDATRLVEMLRLTSKQVEPWRLYAPTLQEANMDFKWWAKHRWPLP